MTEKTTYAFKWDVDGVQIGYGGYKQTVVGIAADERGDVHIHEPGTGSEDGFVKISGDTYRHKDKIKEAEYSRTQRRWSGDFWECKAEYADSIVAIMMDNRVDVTVGTRLVPEMNVPEQLKEHAKGLLGLKGEVEPFEFYDPEDRIVSRSKAEDMAKVANYLSVEDFVEDFNLTVIDDEEAKDRVA